MVKLDNWAIKDLVTFVVGIVGGVMGIAAGYGMLRQQVKTHTEDIRELKESLSILDGTNPESRGVSVFMRRGECEERQEKTASEITEIKKRLDSQHQSLKGLQNYARWVLTTKEHLGIAEVNKILNNEGWPS